MLSFRNYETRIKLFSLLFVGCSLITNVYRQSTVLAFTNGGCCASNLLGHERRHAQRTRNRIVRPCIRMTHTPRTFSGNSLRRKNEPYELLMNRKEIETDGTVGLQRSLNGSQQSELTRINNNGGSEMNGKSENESVTNKYIETLSESITEDDEALDIENEIIILEVEEKDQVVKEELKAAVKEVKEVFQEVKQSTGKLTETIIGKGPGILTRLFRIILAKPIREDIVRRKRHYVSDWTDGFTNKRQVIPATLFLYFACLAPTVSFGTISTQLTNGSIGVVEFLLSAGLSGMAYATFSGQPMAFIAPTGLTLAFISGLFRFCSLNSIPFYPVYSWIGLWTGFFMIILGMKGSSRLIKYCTRFTDEVFNALLSFNFVYEALNSLRRNFQLADPNNLTMPFVSLAMAYATFTSTASAIAFNTSRFLNKTCRNVIKDFGPASIIVIMSLLNTRPWIRKWNVPTLAVPNSLELAGGRDFFVPIFSLPTSSRLLCVLPAVLLTSLFFMDQNISVRLVNKPEHKLKKGSAYNLDMVALGIVTGGLSLVGLPWMCGATVQSLNHVRAMSTYQKNPDSGEIEVEKVTETRVTGFVTHAMIAFSVCLLPLLKKLPIPVVSGVFLYLGRKLMTGNSFLSRIKELFAESEGLQDSHAIRVMGRGKTFVYTMCQIICLLGLWGFKSCSATAIFFPSVIGFLMVIRSFVLPRFFTEEEFVALGDPSP